LSWAPGGARNLKLADNGGHFGPKGTGGNNFLGVAQMSTLFSCCVHGKDVAGPGTEPLVRGSGGEAPLKLKHFKFLDV